MHFVDVSMAKANLTYLVPSCLTQVQRAGCGSQNI